MPKKGDLLVWWVPQMPGKDFEVPVRNLREASLILDVLAKYDEFQYANRIKPDYSNAGDLMIWDGEDWIDWYDEESGDGFDEYRESHTELRDEP